MTETVCTLDDPVCECVLSETMELLGRRYAMEILCIVGAHRTVRFGTLESHLPDASTSTLSARLDELVAAGLIEREQYDEIPPRVEYEPTDRGVELGERLRPLAEWIARDESG